MNAALMNHGAELRTLANTAALAHQMTTGPLKYSFIAMYMNCPEFEHDYGAKARKTNKWENFVMLVTFVGSLLTPYLYSKFVMKYPCNKKKVKLNDTISEFHYLDCAVEDWIQKVAWWYPLALASVAIVVHWCLQDLRWYKRYLFWILNMVGNSRFNVLTFYRSPWLFGWCTAFYMLNLVAMFGLSLGTCSVVPVTVGFAMSESLRKIVCHILSPGHKAIAFVKSKLNSHPVLAQFERGESFVVIDDSGKRALERMHDLVNDANQGTFKRWSYNRGWVTEDIEWDYCTVHHVWFPGDGQLIPIGETRRRAQ